MRRYRPISSARAREYAARATWAEDHREPVYVTESEMDELLATIPPETGQPFWLLVGESPPPPPADPPTLYGVPVLIDPDKAAQQTASVVAG